MGYNCGWLWCCIAAPSHTAHLCPIQQSEGWVWVHVDASCGSEEAIVAHIDRQLTALTRCGQLAKPHPRTPTGIQASWFLQ